MYEFVSTQEVNYPVKTICKALNISRSSYYEYRQGKTHQIDQEAMESVQRMFELHRRRYGSRRISKALEHQGIKITQWLRDSDKNRLLLCLRIESYSSA